MKIKKFISPYSVETETVLYRIKCFQEWFTPRTGENVRGTAKKKEFAEVKIKSLTITKRLRETIRMNTVGCMTPLP